MSNKRSSWHWAGPAFYCTETCEHPAERTDCHRAQHTASLRRRGTWGKPCDQHPSAGSVKVSDKDDHDPDHSDDGPESLLDARHIYELLQTRRLLDVVLKTAL